MAATVNDRDIFLSGETRTFHGVIPSDFEFTGNVTGNLNGIPVQDVIDAANTGGGDVTSDILSNSATSIIITASNLFKTGSGAGGTFIGAGGLFGKNSSGVTKFSVSSTTGLLTAQDAVISGTLAAGSIITNSVTISGSGTTLQQLVDASGSTFDLQGALNAGVTNILAGVGSNYRLDVDSANAFVALRHKDAVYKGTASPGSVKTAVGISSAGIAMGYNRASDGAWVDSVSIDALGNPVFAGTIAANSIIVDSVTIGGVTIGTVKANAATGASVTLSASGQLIGAGGGSITALDYGNVSGTKPPASATANIFTVSTSNPSGGNDGNAHWNSATQVMWFKTAGAWNAGGTVNASSITTGTLAAARIAANSITSDKINVGTLSALSANLGSVTAGNITGTAGIDITGQAKFQGVVSNAGSNYTAVFNAARTTSGGISVYGGTSTMAVRADGLSSGFGLYSIVEPGGNGTSTGIAIYGVLAGSGGTGTAIYAKSASASGTALKANNSGGGNALVVEGAASFFGQITVNAQTVSGLSITGNAATASLSTNSGALGGITASSWMRALATDSGTALASGSGMQLNSALSGIEIAQSGAGNRALVRNISDASLKTNVSAEVLGADFVHTMGGLAKSFEYKSRPGELTHGWIAQDVEAIKPTADDRMAHTHPDGIMGVDYNGLISILYYNLSLALTRIEALEETIQ